MPYGRATRSFPVVRCRQARIWVSGSDLTISLLSLSPFWESVVQSCENHALEVPDGLIEATDAAKPRAT